MRIYFSGIGGVAIGPLAEIAFDAGYGVAGSDLSESLVTKELRQRGILVNIGQDGSFLRNQHAASPIDWFVYTAALPDDHPELVAARQLGLKTSKRDELLAHIIAEKQLKLLAITGTHGKTSTTGMMIWAFKQLGIPISYSIGTTLSWGPSGLFDPASTFFVYECDEFDKNFLHFQPYLSILTAVDYDHPDTYPTEADYMAAFRQFIDQSQQVVLWQVDAMRIHTEAPQAWHLRADEVMPLKLAGEHNRRNGTLVVKALERLEVGEGPSNQEAVSSFPGVNRRFEKLADNLYSDYGHHPVEIAATLQLARELNDHVVLIYQPHQNMRQLEFYDQYTDQLESAEAVYWLPTYLSREDPDSKILSPQQLTERLTNRDHLKFAELDDDLWQTIEAARASGKLVLAMGAGSIDGWLRQKLTT